MTSVNDSKCPVHFFPLATSADRFYRIDRSQVSSFELHYESELSLSQCTVLVVSLRDFANENSKASPDCRTVWITVLLVCIGFATHGLNEMANENR